MPTQLDNLSPAVTSLFLHFLCIPAESNDIRFNPQDTSAASVAIPRDSCRTCRVPVILIPCSCLLESNDTTITEHRLNARYLEDSKTATEAALCTGLFLYFTQRGNSRIFGRFDAASRHDPQFMITTGRHQQHLKPHTHITFSFHFISFNL